MEKGKGMSKMQRVDILVRQFAGTSPVMDATLLNLFLRDEDLLTSSDLLALEQMEKELDRLNAGPETARGSERLL